MPSGIINISLHSRGSSAARANYFCSAMLRNACMQLRNSSRIFKKTANASLQLTASSPPFRTAVWPTPCPPTPCFRPLPALRSRATPTPTPGPSSRAALPPPPAPQYRPWYQYPSTDLVAVVRMQNVEALEAF